MAFFAITGKTEASRGARLMQTGHQKKIQLSSTKKPFVSGISDTNGFFHYL
ncbi:hypothetical protein NCCP2050_07090 [Planococcus sp. NCCP-2050]|nr:hypothetical protein NCCP2050_07090 [Planococcus sp. NCCP-2050]